MNQTRTYNKTLFSLLPYLIFFAGSFLYFALFTEYIFFTQEKSSLFVFSIDFFKENIQRPGGFLIWSGKFLSTFYYYQVAGALILSSVLTLISLFVSKIIFNLTGQISWFIPSLTGLVLFFLQTDFHFFLFNELGLLFQLVLIYLVIRYLTILKGWAPVILIPFWFFITGSFAMVFVLFMTFFILSDRNNKGWIKIISIWLMCIATLYISKEFFFFQTEKALITYPVTDHSISLQLILLAFIAIILALLPFLSKIRLKLLQRLSEFSKILISFIVILVSVISVGILRYDTRAKEYFFVEKLFYQNKFNEVISYNTLHPTVNSLTIFLNNVSLSESGKLDDLLFHFPQSADGKTLFLKWEMAGEILNRGGYFYYSAGMINEAHRWAYENMVMKGLSPEGLKMLIKTEIINGNNEVALKYIKILQRTLFYRNDALMFEKMAAGKIDDELSIKRNLKVQNDFFSITENPVINIDLILASDSTNKKAFEYKMAFLLLTKDFKGITFELPQFERYGYKKLPVHIEEAALALALPNKGKLPDTGNLRISQNTEARWNEYLNILRRYGNNVRTAEPELRQKFGDTFWYWVFYR